MRSMKLALVALLVLTLSLTGCAQTMATADRPQGEGAPADNSGNDKVPDVTIDPGFAAFDTVRESLNEAGQKVIDYLRGEKLVRREVYRVDGIAVFLAMDDNGKLEQTGLIPYNAQDLPLNEKVVEYKNDDGLLVSDYFLNDLLHTRKVYDPVTGAGTVTTYDKDGKVYSEEKFEDKPSDPGMTDPASKEEANKYLDKDGNTVVDLSRDGVVVRREIHYADRYELYEINRDGKLELVGTGQSGSTPSTSGSNAGIVPPDAKPAG